MTLRWHQCNRSWIVAPLDKMASRRCHLFSFWIVRRDALEASTIRRPRRLSPCAMLKIRVLLYALRHRARGTRHVGRVLVLLVTLRMLRSPLAGKVLYTSRTAPRPSSISSPAPASQNAEQERAEDFLRDTTELVVLASTLNIACASVPTRRNT
ncbi:hypothetical protein BD626DRAFT_506696, partial [Schizophyllum amplum]